MKRWSGKFLISSLLFFCQIAMADWHVSQSMVRYRIEPDGARAVVPDVFTIDLEPVGTNPARMRIQSAQPEHNYLWTGRRIYSKGEPMVWPGTVTFELSSAYDRFVAEAGVDDRADGGAAAVFKVWIDDKLLYESPGKQRGDEPAQVNVRIPSGSKQLRLQVDGPGRGGRKIAGWGNAGFTLRGRSPQISQVSLCPAGFDYQQFEPIVTTTAGQVVGSELIHNGPGEPMSILFDSSRGAGLYYVYLVRKGSAPADGWKPRAGLILTTRRSPAIDGKCHEMKGLGELWTQGSMAVGKSVVGHLHHGSPVHGVLSAHYEKEPQSALGIYYYEGYFRTDKPGAYTFASASNWGSYLSVDGTLVVDWPGGHGWQGGHRGEKQGTVILTPGVHRLEYLNCSPWTVMFTLAAWQREEDQDSKPNLRIMTDADFLPVGYYRATAVGYARSYGSMTWRSMRDIRAEQNGPPVVTMAFDYLPAEGRAEADCRWRFDDGTRDSGNEVFHTYFQPGLRQVTLEIIDKESKVLATIEQQVAVYPRWDRVWQGPDGLDEFETETLGRDLSGVVLSDLVALYRFADDLAIDKVKTQAARALAGQAEALSQDSSYLLFALELADYLKGWTLRDYDAALTIYTALTGPSITPETIRQRGLLGRAEILIRIQGHTEEGLKALNLVGSTRALGDPWGTLSEILRAEARMMSDEPELAAMTLQRAAGAPLASGVLVRHQGWLRNARNQISREPAAELDQAADQLMTILTEDPIQLSRCDFLLALIDLYLKRDENQLAWHYCELAGRFDAGEIHRPDLLLRQIRALTALGRNREALDCYRDLKNNYPYSPVIPQARDLAARYLTEGKQ